MILRIYDFLKAHSMIRWGSLISLTLLLALLVMRLSYKEDISDFLPLGTEDREALSIYQDISGANQLYILFKNPKDADETTAAIDDFCSIVAESDSLHWTNSIMAQVDMEHIASVQDYIYRNIPLFLTDNDYARIYSLLSQPYYFAHQLQQDKEMLLFPTGGVLQENIARDPLNLFTPVVAKLQSQQAENHFEIYDGYIFTPDMSRAIVMMSSPFGNAETEQNAKLMQLLDDAITQMHAKHPKVEAHVVGGPQIAVGNAQQIKHDSILAIALSVVLILALLFYSFRSVKNILLIALSIGWGWLFALGGISLFHDNVSIIVIGLSSVILGIAVNYPLHLVAHIGHEPNMRNALKEIVAPLLVGNITTVGAFMALIPLQSTALRDLGIFAALLLIGTIAFVIIYLPHHVKATNKNDIALLTRISSIKLDNKPWLVSIVIILTLFFGWFSLNVEFDSNMANINYMTEQQHEDMAYFQRLMSADTTQTETLYVPYTAVTLDSALDIAKQRKSPLTQFLTSKKEQERRLNLWQEFLKRYETTLLSSLNTAAAAQGFSSEAFTDFASILHDATDNATQAMQDTTQNVLYSTIFKGNISIDREAHRYTIVDKLQLKPYEIAAAKAQHPNSFDVKSMNGALANSLSDNFNYIGIACSAIVFFFLWFSFRRLDLAIISFIPMAISWIWILGLMALLGIKFNIVNIILATFIFGQGDDYTIFMTEGCQYEHETGKSVLKSYKQSILLSALIMLIGIGTLIVARHPALHSLAEVTIIGMACVVFMAWLIPPLLFKLLIKYRTTANKKQSDC